MIDRRVNVGQTVVAGMNAPSLFLLAKDLSHMLVWSAVNEADIGDIEVGQNVTFTVDAYRDRTFSGKVSQIRLNASLQQNVVTYGVIVDVDNTDGKLLPYMTAKLQFEVAQRHERGPGSQPGAALAAHVGRRFRPRRERPDCRRPRRPSTSAGQLTTTQAKLRSREWTLDRPRCGCCRRRVGATGARQGRPVRRNGDGDCSAASWSPATSSST